MHFSILGGVWVFFVHIFFLVFVFFGLFSFKTKCILLSWGVLGVTAILEGVQKEGFTVYTFAAGVWALFAFLVCESTKPLFYMVLGCSPLFR